MIQINQSSSEPIYEQIIKQYKYLVLQGYLKSGDAILSVRKLALPIIGDTRYGSQGISGTGAYRDHSDDPWKGNFYCKRADAENR